MEETLNKIQSQLSYLCLNKEQPASESVSHCKTIDLQTNTVQIYRTEMLNILRYQIYQDNKRLVLYNMEHIVQYVILTV